ncbi:MAG: hypothetical protein ACKVXR_01610 [Planctomycetota bacterium]
MIGRMRGVDERRRGTALVSMLLCLLGMAAISMALMAASLGDSSEQRGERREMRSSYVCLAGLSQAMYQKQRGLPGAVGTQANPVSWNGSLCWVEEFPVTAQITRLRANGVENGIGAAQELTVRAVPNTIWMYGAFGREHLHMDSNARIDSYDSSLGTYASQATNGSGNGQHARTNGDTGSNGHITMDVNGTIWGDSIAGPGYTTTILGNAVVTGTTTPATALVTMPTINVPSYASSGALTVNSNQTLASGNYNFTTLRVNPSKTLTITGPANVVCTNLELRSNSSLLVDPTGGIVTFYVIDDFIMNSNAQLRPTDSVPANLRINLLSDNVINPEVSVQLDEVVLDSNTQIHGCVLAPNAHVEIDSNFQMFGSLMARSLDIDSNARFHFDEALMNATANGIPTFETIAWRETAFSPVGGYGSGTSGFVGGPAN